MLEEKLGRLTLLVLWLLYFKLHTSTIMNHFQIDFDNENFSGLNASICLEKLFRKVVFYNWLP